MDIWYEKIRGCSHRQRGEMNETCETSAAYVAPRNSIRCDSSPELKNLSLGTEELPMLIPAATR